MKKRKKVASRLIGIFFSCVVCLLMILNLVWPDKSYSDLENRSLQTFPTLRLSYVLDGSYGKSLMDWYNDQFVGRGTLVRLSYLIQKAFGARKIDDVFLGKGMLIEDSSQMDKEQMSRTLNAINNFSNSHNDLKSSFMLVPNSISVKEKKLPSFVWYEDQNEQMDLIYDNIAKIVTTIDVRDTLNEHKDEYLYYKTDRHWTSLGAFYAFQHMSNILGIANVDENDYYIYPVANDFKGSLSHKTGNSSLEDVISIYVPKKNPDYLITNDSTLEKGRSIYSSAGLKGSNAYNVFLNGNSGIMHIETNTNSKKHLLLFKDSYANAYVQFLVPYYRTITIVDPRYYFDDINRIIQSDSITDVMYVYNTNSFLLDTSLADVLE